MPNSDPDSPPISGDALGPFSAALLPERDSFGEFDGANVGVAGKGCPPDSAPTSVPVCLPETRASEVELETGDTGCADDIAGSAAGCVVLL
jgi:hypothetical protein